MENRIKGTEPVRRSPTFSIDLLMKTRSIAILGLSILLCKGVFAQNAAPDSIRPPDGLQLVLVGHASGDQIYVCRPSLGGNSQFGWVFSAPEARLFDETGKEIATHFAGPTWKSTDGSQVKGKVVAQTVPDPDSIPWLLLTAADHEGNGIMSQVASIQRINTKGGKAPAGGCDAQHQGETRRVSYTADYYFYSPAR